MVKKTFETFGGEILEEPEASERRNELKLMVPGNLIRDLQVILGKYTPKEEVTEIRTGRGGEVNVFPSKGFDANGFNQEVVDTFDTN